MDEPLHFLPTWTVLKRRWRLFAGVAAAAILLSSLFSSPPFIKPKYRSRAVVYPVHISTYSIETTTDQLLQLLESNSIRDSLVERFGLVEHYKVDTARRGGRTLLEAMYNERVSIQKTRYESVDIQVLDEDPVTARDMAAEIIRQADLLARRLQRENSATMLQVVRLGLRNTKRQLDSVEARMGQLRAAGLLDYGTQAKEYSRGYVQSLAGGGGKAPRQEIDTLLKALEAHGGEFLRLSSLGNELLQAYGEQLSQERQVVLDLGKELSYSTVVVHPEVADKKAYPIRWLIVAISTLSALLLCYVLVSLNGQGRTKAGD